MVAREVDAILRRGGKPDPVELASRFCDEPDRIRSIVELRSSLFEEGILDDSAEEPETHAAAEAETEPAPLPEPRAEGRDHALADIKCEFQDAMNRGDRPDLDGIMDERPELKDDVAELSQFYNFIADALRPDVGLALEPVQEVVLSHFRLVTMHARHPLGGMFLGVDQHTGRHAELLVIRGHMSKSRSGRLLRDALSLRDVADPGFVPVIDAGEVHDLRFVAWEYKADLTLERIIRMLRRSGGHRTLRQILADHGEPSDVSRDPTIPPNEAVPDGADDSASRLLANPLHVASVLDLVADVAETLDRAHLRGLILGDVRPTNVFANQSGRARVRGFGLVQHARAAWHRLGSDVTFLAPEVLADDEPGIDWRADVWGVALLLYSALALRDPPDFSATTRRTERLFVDLRGAPEGLLPLINQALERDPIARPASCGAIAEELRRMAAALRPPPPAPPPSSLPRWFWYALAAVIVVGAAVVLILAVL
jgi:Protein kinase domain